MAHNIGAIVTISIFLLTYNLKCHLFVISGPVFLKGVMIRGTID
jgi:hypothetical protein